MSTTAPYRLVDVEDLEDGDLAARIAEIGMPPVPAPRRVPGSPAARQAEVDAVVLAWTVARDRRTALSVHGPVASAAALLA